MLLTQHSKSQVSKNIVGKLPAEQLCDELDADHLSEEMNTKKDKDEEENDCIIIDDVSSNFC